MKVVLEKMNDLSVLRIPLKQILHIHIMKSNKTKSREVSLTVDGVIDMASSVWNKIRSSKLTIRVDPI